MRSTAIRGLAATASGSFLVLFIACSIPAIALAVPEPGTPGNSGDKNPHGAPPGQGGEIPGDSGDNNPHGSPPGQRIDEGNPLPEAPVSPASLPVVESVFLMKGLADGVGILAKLGTPSEAMPDSELRRLSMAFEQIRGWESGWRDMYVHFDGVSVKARMEMVVNGEVFTQETVAVKNGDREHGHETGSVINQHEWLRLPPVLYERFGKGAWRKNQLSTQRKRDGDSRGFKGEAWPPQAKDILIERDCTGRRLFSLRLGDGRFLVWELDNGGNYVRKLRGYDANRHLDWEESREVETYEGIAVILSRSVKYYTLPGGELTERIEWGPGQTLSDEEIERLLR